MNFYEGDQNFEDLILNRSPHHNVPQFSPNHSHTTKIFRKAAKHFWFTNKLTIGFSIIRIIVGLSLVGLYFGVVGDSFYSTSFNSIVVWTIYTCFLETIKCVYLIQMGHWLATGVNYRVVAFKLSQIHLGGNEELEYHNMQIYAKNVGILASQIRYEALKSSCFVQYANKIETIIFHLLMLWAFVFIFYYFQGSLRVEETILFFYLVVLVVINLYEHVGLYAILLLIILFSPLILLAFIIYLIKRCINKREQEKLKESLNHTKYKPGSVQGDPSCSICQSTYAVDDEIIILNCAPTHHFHSGCIMPWLEVSDSCPLCRKPVNQAHNQPA